jgi:hypothetical protein
MRHTSWLGSVASIWISSVLAVGCSCASTRVTHRDTGTPDPEQDAALVTEDGAVVQPDAWFPDTGPRQDSGCGATTPVMNEIIGDPPDMLIVLDLSGSMCSPVGIGGMSRIAVMKNSLTTAVMTFDSRIDWGLMEFPQVMSTSMAAACSNGILRCPIMPHNAASIVTRIGMYPTGPLLCANFCTGGTPTPGAMMAARDYFASIPVNPVGRYVLLATDGEPNCGPVDDAGNSAPTVDETVAAITALRGDGIDTYVLGFGSGFAATGAAALMRMAVAGGTAMPYNARSATELDMALNTIAASIIPPTCTIMLEGGTRNPDLFQVSFDGGALIPRDTSHGSGWDYDAATNTITFYGAECTHVESGSVASIDVEFGCPGPLI